VRILSTNPDEPGIFAIGQVATGIFAFGQMATGVIAIGQLARGVVAVGQLAIGFVAIGQACYSVIWGGGMVGITGRGFGFVLKTIPKYRPDGGAPSGYEACVLLDEVRTKGFGLVHARIRDHRLVDEDGTPLAVEPTEPTAAMLQSSEDSEALVNVAAEVESETDGTYREAPHLHRILRAQSLRTYRRWPWPFEAISGNGCAPLWQLVLRGIALVAVIVGWSFIAGTSIVDMFR
jgi:hypothetical protein